MRTFQSDGIVLKIFALVFGIIGFVFSALGIAFGFFIDKIAASPNSHGDVYIIPWVFGFVGIVFLLAFAVMVFIMANRKTARRRLIEDGRFVNAAVAEVNRNLFVRINNRHPYFVVCEYEDPFTGEKRSFRSDDIMEDPSYLLGRQLRVFIDRENPKRYFVELNRRYGD